MSFLHFFAVFYKKYSDLLQVFFQCKKYSESTAGNVTQRKTVIFTADIFAVYNHQTITYSRLVPNFQQRRTIPKCRGPRTVEMFGEASRLSIRQVILHKLIGHYISTLALFGSMSFLSQELYCNYIYYKRKKIQFY